MKKAIWILALIAEIGTAAVLPFLPETVPVHFDAAWNPDRWGSRWELLLLPAIPLILAAAWKPLLKVFEKKAAESEDDKLRASAQTNIKAIGIAGISLAAMLTLVQAWLLLRVFRSASGVGVSGDVLDRLPFIFVGLLFVVFGNIMPKTRRNGVIGFRMAWSMYNDETWRRTHRFGGYAMVAAGILVVLAAALVSPPLAMTAVLLVLVTASILVTLIYAHKVYTEEKERSESHEE